MSTKQDHLNYIQEKGSFTVDCDLHIFKPGELEILEKYGHWFQALALGILQPITEEQREFLKVVSKEKTPVTLAENAWHRYMGRKATEAKDGDRLKVQYKAEDDTFYSRDMVKKQRGMVFSEVSKNHKL